MQTYQFNRVYISYGMHSLIVSVTVHIFSVAYYWYRSNLLRELAQDNKVLVQVLDGILGFLRWRVRLCTVWQHPLTLGLKQGHCDQ